MKSSFFALALLSALGAPALAEDAPRLDPDPVAEAALDKRDIRHRSGFVSDSDDALLRVPRGLYEVKSGDFTVAKTPPTLDFSIAQLQPESLPYDVGVYGGWSQPTTGPDGAFYTSIGNHRGDGAASAYIFRVDPKAKTQRIIVDTGQVAGWKADEFGDGKMHGTPSVAPGGEMWMLTFYGPYPTAEQWKSGAYPGGRLIHANALTGKTEFVGVPDRSESWPQCVWDWQRQRLYGIGEWGVNNSNLPDPASPPDEANYGKLLVYDTKNRRVIRSTLFREPNGQLFKWWRRSLELDRQSGRVYGSECVAPYRMAVYDPATDSARVLPAQLDSALLNLTDQRATDGMFYLSTQAGKFYKFSPVTGQVAPLGTLWTSDESAGETVESLRTSPGGRYVYYAVSSTMTNAKHGFPIVQYDVRTGTKKVLAFLNEFYTDKYGYAPSNTYGITLSADGSQLFLQINGVFSADLSSAYGRPALMVVHIPASERADDR